MQPLSTAARLSAGPVAAMIAINAAEVAIVIAYLGGSVGEGAALAAHGAALLVFAARRKVFADDLTLYVIALLLTASTGPVGAAATLVLYLVLARIPVSEHELESWYRQISGVGEANPAVALHAQILDGRARRPSRRSIDHFPSVLEGGLGQQQALLGLIGLSYHPDYRPLLGQALRSTEPSIRVHAAAVSVKLRARARLEFQKTRAEGRRPATATALVAQAADLARLANGGFLDETDARSARESAASLCEEALAASPGHRGATAQLCALLAELGRWDEVLARAATVAYRRGDILAEAVAESLMQLGRTQDLHDLLVRPADPVPGGRHALPV
ncbi:hypothetical protein U8607_09770 [Methylobacterium durans]|uniref:hypothetical protein n=1 Tax=Methylobacterium durans TaxID=2202825 RepID=UPI002B0009A4|nr:hypothetical protein [Methylobacterium durans]MEA1832372.1 hypothetical protein [Methylobacterium durans]